jgi:hypothetical protein
MSTGSTDTKISTPCGIMPSPGPTAHRRPREEAPDQSPDGPRPARRHLDGQLRNGGCHDLEANEASAGTGRRSHLLRCPPQQAARREPPRCRELRGALAAPSPRFDLTPSLPLASSSSHVPSMAPAHPALEMGSVQRNRPRSDVGDPACCRVRDCYWGGAQASGRSSSIFAAG